MQRRSASTVRSDSSSTELPLTDPPAAKKERRRRRKKRHSSLARPFLATFLVALVLLLVWKRRHHARRTQQQQALLRPHFEFPPLPQDTFCPDGQLLSRAKLDKSLALGFHFLSKHQRPSGVFDYEYDWLTGQQSSDDMSVRQAGALWGLALIFHDMVMHGASNNAILTKTAQQIMLGLDFFKTHSRVMVGEHGVKMRHVAYPGDDAWNAQGTQALLVLTLVDFLRGASTKNAGVTPEQVQDYTTFLHELLPFLVTQHTSFSSSFDRFDAWNRMVESGKDAWKNGDEESILSWWKDNQVADGYFYSQFNLAAEAKGKASPYYDGESLLAIVKAAKYLRYKELWPLAWSAAHSLHKRHVVRALQREKDSDETKGIYQWMSMALFELVTVQFGRDLPTCLEQVYNVEELGNWLMDLATWMVKVHRTLHRSKNTGYAYEGIVPAWAWGSYVLQQHNDSDLTSRVRKLQCTIEKGMDRLIGWQVGMGAENIMDGGNFEEGLGGVQNAEDESGLRIDVTQHQMHATILARRLVYPQKGASWPFQQVPEVATEVPQ